MPPKIEEYCEVPSPTLRCSKAKRGLKDTVLVCVKYKGHKTTCHFETFPGGVMKSQSNCPACGFDIEKG
jgi:hypothetical protein